MKKLLRISLRLLGLLILLLFAVILWSGGKGYYDALADSGALAERADRLIEDGRGGTSLGESQLAILIKVQDPGFGNHKGVDLTTPGAGLTTITQSLSKRLAFETFQPGFAKIRQTGYALGLEARLGKQQILALWLATVPMGEGPDGWITGFHAASQAIYDRAPPELDRDEFLRLVAVLIAPGAYDLSGADTKLDDRVSRIEKLIAGECRPTGLNDVWLEACGN
ncbi:glycosyl transferase [Pseudohoeflea suaedae]|uniref:Glycosyl transferase n=1 Tax=Pseudohoeflea suaedae TaxID=877384 RepID=A0A4R5PLC7_9HYPH|nr:transglycosylase domain-containing protein [Pseudohoeflea suaedae]TDH37740.1 glycosyl transferase [Pseudohoeflea suaedae]